MGGSPGGPGAGPVQASFGKTMSSTSEKGVEHVNTRTEPDSFEKWDTMPPHKQKELLTQKPLNSPRPKKWVKLGGQISISENGVWCYSMVIDGNTITVNYKYGREGYPDFEEAGVVIAGVKIDPFKGDKSDFGRADKAKIEEEGSPKADTSTWHHNEDMIHMQEIPTKIHRRFTHRGGASKAKKK